MRHSIGTVSSGRGRIILSTFLVVMVLLLAVSCSDFIDVMRGGTVSFVSDYGDPIDDMFVLGLAKGPEMSDVTGYTFAGWYTDEGFNTRWDFSTPVTEDMTLYAKWVISTCTVTYDANGATSGTAPASQTKTYGVDLILQSNSGTLEKSGLFFGGWNTAADGSGTDYGAGASYTTEADLILYAKWVDGYAIAYYANGGSGSVPTTVKQPGETVSIASGSGFSRSGSAFVSWNTAADGSGTQYAPGGSYSADAALNLYAQWMMVVTASDGQLEDAFGNAVAVSGNYMVVGAHHDDIDSKRWAGSAYFYHRDSETGLWGEEQKVQMATPIEDGLFGNSVDISGEYAVIGAPGGSFGSMYIYRRNSSGVWEIDTTIASTSSDAGTPQVGYSAEFGFSVAIDGDRIIAGAIKDTPDYSGSDDAEGSAFIFERDSATGWSSNPTSKIYSQALYDKEDAWFGYDVDISGDSAVIGSYHLEISTSIRGAAYIFERDSTDGQWKSIDQDSPVGEGYRDGRTYLGYDVAIDQGTVCIGSPDFYKSVGDGIVHVVERDETDGWPEWNSWTWSLEIDGGSSDNPFFGSQVAISGDTLVAGADGMIFMYTWDEGSNVWSKEKEIPLPVLDKDADFAYDGNTLAIGTPGYGAAGTNCVYIPPL